MRFIYNFGKKYYTDCEGNTASYEDFEYEPDTNELAVALAELNYDWHFDIFDVKTKKQILSNLADMIYENDMIEFMSNGIENSLQEYFRERAYKKFLCE